MRRIFLALFTASLVGIALIFGAGEVLSRAAAQPAGSPPPELHASDVRIPSSPSGTVAGWFTQGTPGCGTVLLLHGVRSNRIQMSPRAKRLHANGYSVLLIDLPAHGESSGDQITFGAREGAGVLAALSYLRRQMPNERIGVIGVSLGAAAIVLSRPSPPADAVVLESMYPSIAEAIANRMAMRLGSFGVRAAPLLLWQLPLRLGIQADELRPIDAIAELGSPVLIASGTRDQHTPWAETESIFAAATQPKELWAVEGAKHVDLYSFDPIAYESTVFRFLHQHLRGKPRLLIQADKKPDATTCQASQQSLTQVSNP
ncbi:MAG: alpha/beta hydrolase [Azoarcus sp.]|jgi:fermentation-respiration switch protein FrsA (DUF1100 family)|nr:alpha/beta hydrolase [Azoarcus sp.]